MTNQRIVKRSYWLRHLSVLGFLSAALCGTLVAHSKDIIALKLDSITTGGDDSDFTHSFGSTLLDSDEVITLISNASNSAGDGSNSGGSGGGGKPIIGPISVVKRLGATSPNFFLNLVRATHATTGSLEFYHVDTSSGAPTLINYYSIQLFEVFINSDQVVGSEAKSKDLENITMSFSKICMVDHGSARTVCYDLARGTLS